MRIATWLDALTPLQTGVLTVIVSAIVHACLVYVFHWATDIVLWSAMTVIAALLNARRVWQQQKSQD
jgi:hypothetical protein